VPLKELLVDGDILDSYEATARLVFGYPVDEQRGMAVTESIEQNGNIEAAGHAWRVFNSRYELSV
jgi:hypothetical protein